MHRLMSISTPATSSVSTTRLPILRIATAIHGILVSTALALTNTILALGLMSMKSMIQVRTVHAGGSLPTVLRTQVACSRSRSSRLSGD